MLIEKLVSDLKLREYMLSVITYMRRQKRKIKEKKYRKFP